MKEIAGIYCRLSEEDRFKKNKGDDSESIQNQKSMLVTYVCEKGWDIYNIYSDEDYSGSDRNRPQFNQMLKDAEAGRINIIVCKSQSRFSRELEIIEKYIHGYFLVWGVRFISIVDNADTLQRGNKKARQINGLINEWYLEDLSDSIKSVLDDKRAKGQHIGSSAVYGYKKDPGQKGHIIIDEPAAEIVREIFQMFASGIGKTEITRILNRRKVPNPTAYKYESGIYKREPSGKYSNLWGYHVVARILTNEMYIGNMIQGTTGTVSYKMKKKKRIPREEWYYHQGTHEPIIERELWDKVQNLVREKATPRRDGKVSVFARKVRCAYCGYIMHTTTTAGRRYLKCTTAARLSEACGGSFIPEKVLAGYVMDEFKSLRQKYLDRDMAEALISVPEGRRDQGKQIEKEIKNLEEKTEKCQKALKELYLDKISGDITREEFQSLGEKFRGDIAEYKTVIEARKAELSELGRRSIKNPTKKDIFIKYADINELNYDIMNIFIDHIMVGHRKNHQEEYPVKIFWKF